MATNICSKTRRSFVSAKKIADQYDMSEKQVYQLLKLPVFEESKKKIGSRGIRIDQDMFYETLEKYFK